MSFSAPSSLTASVLDFNNDQRPPSPVPSPSLRSYDDSPSDLLVLDSFIPILRNLGRGFYLDQNLYYISGSITEDDWARLRDYAGTVSKFVLTDKDSEAQISPAAFLRLARLQQPNMPLLPRLSDIVIKDADASITLLDLLLTPSLKSLTASCIPHAQQPTFFSFLTAIKQEAPLLQTLILGPGRFSTSSLQAIFEFNNLRHLELKHEDAELPSAFFDSIGSLPMLETLILDARNVSSTRMENRSEEPSLPPASKDISPFPLDNFLNSNPVDSKHTEDGIADAQPRRTSIPPSGTFNRLTKLHINGWLPVIEDLFRRITSTQLEDVSVTFIRLSYDELKIHMAKEKVEREIREEERRRRDEAEKKREEEEKLWREEMERKRINEEKLLREEAEKKRREEERRRREEAENEEERWQREKAEKEEEKWPREMAENEEERWRREEAENEAERWRKEQAEDERREEAENKRREEERWCREDEIKMDMEIEEPNVIYSGLHASNKRPKKGKKWSQKAEMQTLERERLLKEQDRLASLSFDAHTASFTEILRTLCCQWAAPLKRVSISQLGGGSFEYLSKPPNLPKEMFTTLLLLPAIESLEVRGWILDSVESVLSVAESITLKSLLLPLDETNLGVSLFTLRRIAESFPNLETFQCHIQSPDSIPEYPIPTTDALSHELQTLSLGSSSILPDAKRLYLIARHVYLLFPDLKTINTSEKHNAEQWATVDEFVKMFQTARMDDMNRPPLRITNRI